MNTSIFKKNRHLGILIFTMSVFGAVFSTFATDSSNGTVYMTRDFAMSFCEPYISADNGNLKLNLTAEEAAAMGLNPKDYAEIVRNYKRCERQSDKSRKP